MARSTNEIILLLLIAAGIALSGSHLCQLYAAVNFGIGIQGARLYLKPVLAKEAK